MSFDNSKVIATKGYLINSADAIRRKLGTSDTITLPNFESAIDSIPSGGGSVYTPTFIKIQKYFSEPEIGSLPDNDHLLIYTDWVYLESAGATIVPSFPSDGYENKLVVSDVQDPTDDTIIANATIFYLFSSDNTPRARGSYPNEITYSGSHNTQQAPAKIYSYDPTGTFEWTEVTIDSTTWNNKGYYNYVNRIVYSDNNVVRNTVASNVYLMIENIISETGKISNVYKTDYFDVYYCSQGTQVNSLNAVTQLATVNYIGNMNLLGLYQLLTSGTFPPVMLSQSRQEEQPSEEIPQEETPSEEESE